jgi:8-oxo-dGDP phosphatase
VVCEGLAFLASVGAIRNNRTVARKLPDDPGPWEAFNQTYLHRCPPWLVLRQQGFRLPTGRCIENYWINEYPPWVNVVAVTRADQLVMVRQYRPGLEAVHYELPAGTTETNEPSETAARRELLEETGYAGGRWRLLCQLSANPALQNNLTATYLAEDVEPLSAPTPEGTEDLRTHLVPVRDVLRLFDEGEIVQALHTAPLLRYLLQRRDLAL